MGYLEERQARVAARWGLHDEVVVVGAGAVVPVAGSGDQTYPFVPHPEYRYLADDDQPLGVIAFDPLEGWVRFAPEVTQAQSVWEGVLPSRGVALSRLAEWLGKRRGRPLAALGGPSEGVAGEPGLSAALREKLKEVRRAKDREEVSRVRRATEATARGFARAAEFLQPGVTEREVQIEIEAEFFRSGADRTGYGTIVGSGPNSGVLHFTPSPRRIQGDEIVLIDAGAEVKGYCADVTRSFVSTSRQKDLYAVVLEAEKSALSKCRPGKSYREIHMEAALDLAAGLVHLGLLRGDPTSLVARDAHAVFFPHGIGHLVGLGVRDGDSAPTRPANARPTLKYLRLDLDLSPGLLVTIEPGLYFIPALLDDPALREKHATEVAWDKVETWREMGGIRIEDNVLVTAGEPDILTASIPK